VPSREQAVDAVSAGRVLVAGAPASKPARLVGPGEAIVLTGARPRYVSRGGEKLDAALDHFGVAVAGRRALDVGASTGGFTDCLLQRGAERVVAVDVGRAQLHERLRADARVQSVERTDIRRLSLDQVGGRPFELVVVDLAFISLRSVSAAVLGPLAAPGADVVALIKPQFEAGRRHVSAGRGVVRNPQVWAEVLDSVHVALTGHGAAMMGAMVSPLTAWTGGLRWPSSGLLPTSTATRRRHWPRTRRSGWRKPATRSA
jgi:23S rRNA (cytidine1920-2'-O)/16S rRNA (cytidine1409-2'-O)-methyltransferase